MIKTIINRLFGIPSSSPTSNVGPRNHVVLITESCISHIQEGIAPEVHKHHESILYLGGITDGETTLLSTVIKPDAVTGPGRFHVNQAAMADVVRKTSKLGLFVAGQLHTHPREAFHSEGDDEGAKICYDGYVSIVLPDYGMHFPSFNNSAVFVYSRDGFVKLSPKNLKVIPSSIL